MPNDAPLVTVARFDRLHEAQLAQTQLDDADIPCMVTNADATGLSSMFDAERSRVQVKVPADRADEARAVLDVADDATDP
jgi:hypothetical protein